MKLKRAIEILENFPRLYDDVLDDEDTDAVKLGIEALKWIKDWRRIIHDPGDYRLTGETKE